MLAFQFSGDFYDPEHPDEPVDPPSGQPLPGILATVVAGGALLAAAKKRFGKKAEATAQN